MSGEPEFGSGAYYGGGNPAPGGFGGMAGLPSFGQMGPAGLYGAWPSCGCSSCFIILAGLLLVFGGCLRMLGQ
jgi:hypothetical protein